MNKQSFVYRPFSIIILILLIFLISACNLAEAPAETLVDTESTNSDSESPAETDEEEMSSEDVTEVWIVSPYPEGVGAQPFLAEMATEYESANPNVRIKWEWAGFELFDQRIRGYIEADNPPDAFGTAIEVLTQYAIDGVTQPLDAYLQEGNYEGDSTWEESFYPALMEQNYIEDAANGAGFYTIPTQMHISGIFYNTNLFEEQGVTPPQTIQGLLDISAQLESAGITPFAVDGSFAPYIARTFAYVASRVGGAQLYYDTAMHAEGTSWIDNPDWLTAATITRQIFNYHQEGFLGSQWPAAQIEFAQGHMGMVIMATWLPAELEDEAPEGFEMAMFRFPSYEGGAGDQTVTELNFNGYSVPEGAQHADEAIAFLKFLSSRYATEIQAERFLIPSPTIGAAMPASLAKVEEILSTSTMMPFGMGVNNYAVEWRTNVLEPLLADLALGMAPEEFVKELQMQSDVFYTQ